ncbi:hypothetical protein MTR_6g472240 [Medicago truncatula]|uniref:Uncharacterized protein n=1 Tax=Medicago truncatula TaxID=3880 RepID=A0A072UBA0_MEDTR|nr:hypothetical protein MTR_6g472240 [Medicago truncatula]
MTVLMLQNVEMKVLSLQVLKGQQVDCLTLLHKDDSEASESISRGLQLQPFSPEILEGVVKPFATAFLFALSYEMSRGGGSHHKIRSKGNQLDIFHFVLTMPSAGEDLCLDYFCNDHEMSLLPKNAAKTVAILCSDIDIW